MSVRTPGAFGVILRRNDRTHPFIQEQVERLRRVNPERSAAEIASWLNQDADLFACSVAQDDCSLEAVLQRLATAGCAEGVDFVSTASGVGVLGDLPDWLEMSLEPTGNPPELEARMTPEVREMWQSRRARIYTLVVR